MSERELVVGLDELSRFEVQCPDCKAGILLDVVQLLKTEKTVDTGCPSCGGDHLPRGAVIAYKNFVNAVRESTAIVKFRIKE